VGRRRDRAFVKQAGGDRVFALSALLDALRERAYRFVTPTPATHARVLARKTSANDLRDVFGWSLPFARDAIDAEIVQLLEEGGALETRGELLASTLRVSSLDDFLLLHSAYPTQARDAVFFGPDSYRFARFIDVELALFAPRKHIVDIGAGTGVGAIVAGRLIAGANLTLVDVNPAALALAQINVLDASIHAGLGGETGAEIAFLQSDGLSEVGTDLDAIIANPPYIADPAHRSYRDGGGRHGGELSLRWAEEAATRLTSGGVLLLYTGSAIVGGEDRLKTALESTLADFDVTYRELDPDVFGEELEREDYADVERIAVVGVVAVKR
jgi:methylase of polypeptide subunit release factors